MLDEFSQKSIADSYRGEAFSLLAKKYNCSIDEIHDALDRFRSRRYYFGPYELRSTEFKTDVADFYSTPHSKFTTAKYFFVGHEFVERVAKEFNLPLRSTSEEHKIARTDKYGSLEQYREHIARKTKETSLRRYGVSNFAKSPLFVEKSRETSLRKYGVENPNQDPSIKEKLMQTCMSKYGVPYFCMTSNCRGSGSNNSKPNLAFAQLLSKNNVEFSREFCIDRFSYDFRVGNTLLEIDPTPTHNSTWGVFSAPPLDKLYHYNKSKLAVDHGLRCIHLWDWDDYELVLTTLRQRKRVYARKCLVRELDISEANKFFDCHHLQGKARALVAYGLYFEEQLVSAMSFGKPRYNKKAEWELVRFCSTYQVVGGAEKLFFHFCNIHHPESVVSYCDKSKFTGKMYTRLGFVETSVSVSKHWYNMKTHVHITNNLLVQRGFDQLFGKIYGCFGKGTSNEDLMRQHGFVEIYDAGQTTYIWQAN